MNFKKLLTVILTVAMVLGTVNFPAFAEGEIDVSQDVTEISDVAQVNENEDCIDEENIENETDAISEAPEYNPEETDVATEVFSEDVYSDEENCELQSQFDDAVVLLSETDTEVSVPEGEGTKENPYKIYTEEELISFAVGNITDGISAYWELHSDIELTADTWAPIGAYTPFSGYFDGKGHTISSSKLFQSTAMSGIFGQNAGVIKNLNVDVTIEEVATNTGTLCAVNNGTIENCHVTGSITTSENKNIGGLVGWNENGEILNCSSSVIIDAPNSTVGGLVGYNKNASIKYSWTYNKTADVNEEEELVCGNTVGGLVGYAYNDNSSVTSLISNCYTLGKIKGGSTVGGLIGYCNVYASQGYITVEYCYAKGVITAGDIKGGLIGNINNTSRVGIRYCYFNNVNNYNKYGYGISLVDITKKETFYDWNFDEIWAIDPDLNNGYPYIDYKGSETVTIDGDGTEENPYVITNEKQLCYLASEKLPLDAHYILGNNVQVTANYWTPIASVQDRYFTGVFDGNGYSVTGVHTENIYYNSIGLFGRSSGTIKNLTVESWFKGNNYVGGLVGINSGVVENCNSYIEELDYCISGAGYVGGLAGQNRGIITKSFSTSNVDAPGAKAGGLVGEVCNGKVSYCYATGNVIGDNAGGLVGYVYNDVANRTTTIISNCYAMGKITGTSNSGGLLGYCNIHASQGYITIEYCYARGLVVEQGSTGGLMGNYNNYDRTVVRYCYYNIANTGNAIGFGVKAAQLKLQDTFYGWDFENIWKIDKTMNSGYPVLDIRGETPVNYLEGNGEEDRPYLIYTEEDLRSLVADVYGPYDLSIKHFYKLMNDIEVTANFWTPIGANGVNAFNGIFDGNGHTISGIKLSNSYYNRSGLFGVVTGTVKNLTVEADISGKWVGAICGESNGTIENCSSSGTLSAGNSTNRYAGGIVGCNSGTVTKSSSSANVSCPALDAGGIAGRSVNGTITYCYSTAVVNGAYAGGLVGRLYNDNSSTTSLVRNCYATGEVTGIEYAGGLVGYCQVYASSGNTMIEYSYSTALIDSAVNNGGLVGNRNGRERNFVRYSYYNAQNTGALIGFEASLGQLADKDLYYMWDFDNIWDIDPDVNGGYPYLNVRGTTKAHYLDGYGDEDDPYMIEDEEDLWTLVLGNYDLTGKYYYQLQNDIEITAEHWTPIGGNYGKAFNGIFDGNGYTISGLKISQSAVTDQGLFGNNNGTIKNLNVIGNIVGDIYTGMICAVNTGTIDNCSAIGTVTSWKTTNDIYTGGLVGINHGTISNSHSSVLVDGKNWDAGGIAGRNNGGTISQCYATGNVSGKYVGGLVGRQYNDNGSAKSVINNCYASGDVNGIEYAGGLVGFSDIYASQGYTEINNSYSIGKVTGGKVGGLVGFSDDAVRNSILSSYYNQTNTGLNDIDRGTPLEDAAMKLQSSYVGWDYSNIWSIDENVNNGYPTLRDQTIERIIPVTGVALNTNEATVNVGGSVMLTATIIPDAATNQELNWSSSNEKYAVVSNGKVTGRQEGSAEITVTTLDGGYTATCVVTVSAAPTTAVTGVSLNKTVLSLVEGNSDTLTATVTPTDATNKTVSWKSSDTGVATVSNGKVTAVSAGTATITATTSDGGYTASCVVKVTAVDTTVSATGVKLNKSAVSLEEGKTETLVATVSPSDATNKAVSWKSSDAGVVTVVNGKVTAISAGTAIITATTADGGYTAICTVTVTEKIVDENAPKITIKDIKTMPGKEIAVTVELENNPGFASLGIEVGYDSDIMTLTNVTSNTGVGGTFTKAQYLSVNPFNMGWDSASDITYNGNLATLTFTVGEDVADGIYPITLDYYKGVNGNYVDGENINYDENFEAVGFVYISGNVIVASYIPGDINGDESVDNKDATFLLRYLAGWGVAGIVEDALDVDGNNYVDNKDATILLRYLAGWDVTLH